MEAATVRLDNGREAVRRGARAGAVRARRQEVVIAALGDFLHGLDRERARNPDRRPGPLPGLGPDVDVAQRKVPPLVRAWPVLGPAAVDQVNGLPKPRARLRLGN